MRRATYLLAMGLGIGLGGVEMASAGANDCDSSSAIPPVNIWDADVSGTTEIALNATTATDCKYDLFISTLPDTLALYKKLNEVGNSDKEMEVDDKVDNSDNVYWNKKSGADPSFITFDYMLEDEADFTAIESVYVFFHPRAVGISTSYTIPEGDSSQIPLNYDTSAFTSDVPIFRVVDTDLSPSAGSLSFADGSPISSFPATLPSDDTFVLYQTPTGISADETTSFTYSVGTTIDNVASAPATITLNTEKNDPPVASDIARHDDEDTIHVLEFDVSDVNAGQSLTVTLTSVPDPSRASLYLLDTAGNGAADDSLLDENQLIGNALEQGDSLAQSLTKVGVSFVKDFNSVTNGEDVYFTYSVADDGFGTLSSSEASVNITVDAVNDAPIAYNLSYSFQEDQIPILVIEPTYYDVDTVDGDYISLIRINTVHLNANITLWSLFSEGVNGTTTTLDNLNASLNVDEKMVSYSLEVAGQIGCLIPDNWYGNITFNYRVFDSESVFSNPLSSILVEVIPVDDTPVSYDSFYSVDEDSIVVVDLLYSDGDELFQGDVVTAYINDAPNDATLFAFTGTWEGGTNISADNLGEAISIPGYLSEGITQVALSMGKS